MSRQPTREAAVPHHSHTTSTAPAPVELASHLEAVEARVQSLERMQKAKLELFPNATVALMVSKLAKSSSDPTLQLRWRPKDPPPGVPPGALRILRPECRPKSSPSSAERMMRQSTSPAGLQRSDRAIGVSEVLGAEGVVIKGLLSARPVEAAVSSSRPRSAAHLLPRLDSVGDEEEDAAEGRRIVDSIKHSLFRGDLDRARVLGWNGDMASLGVNENGTLIAADCGTGGSDSFNVVADTCNSGRLLADSFNDVTTRVRKISPPKGFERVCSM